MSDRELSDYLEDIVTQIGKLEQFVRNINSFEEFQQNEMAVYACIRAFEIIGEAVKQVPDNVRQKYPQVPWRTIAGFRDVLIHAYFGIDEHVVWNAIEEELPHIKPIFENMLTEVQEVGMIKVGDFQSAEEVNPSCSS